MARLRSGTFAAWCCAWLSGTAATDDVLEAIVADDAPHLVDGLPGTDTAPLSEVLITLRRSPGPVRLLLPVAGDVRGLAGPAEFRAAALDAGEAVMFGEFGMVPEIVEHAPSSAPTSVTWHVVTIESVPVDHVSVGEANEELLAAVRDCTSALTAAGVSGATADVGDALRTARRAGERLVLPPGYPQRAVALLARAEQLYEVLELAAEDPLGGAVDRFAASAREASLRPLATAVRRARLAGYNALADAMVS